VDSPESPPRMSLPRRALAFAAAVSAAAFTLVALPAISVAPAPGAAAATSCLPGYADYPNLNDDPSTGTAAGVTAYFGGDFLALPGAQETEGVIVVGGDATYNTGAWFNTGVVGVGSQVRPPAGSDMLITGGNTTVASGTLEVAHGSSGNIVAGGSITGSYVAATATPNAVSPLTTYADFASHNSALSTEYAALSDTGTVVATDWDVTFTSTNADPVQVFTVSGADLGASLVSKTMVFSNIPADAVIIINVTGTAPTLWANQFFYNGTAIVPDAIAGRVFSHVTQSLLWNFSEATSLALGDGDQLLGSVIAPHTTTTALLTSTNGRVYLAGDVTMGGSVQEGIEIHSYTFREPFDCPPADGSLSISKALTDADGVVDDTTIFTGHYACVLGAATIEADWSLKAGASLLVEHLPAGANCTVTEDSLTTAPSADDSSYHWLAPSFSANNVVIASDLTSTVVVQNAVRHALGDLTLVKVLDDPFDVVDPSRVYTGTFHCEFNGDDVTPATATWATIAGAPAITLAIGLPEGTECTVAEDDLDVPPLAGFPQYQWVAATISPSPVTIEDGVTHVVTVTNTVVDPVITHTGELVTAGTDSLLPLYLGGGVVALGALLIAFGSRRRMRALRVSRG
jgi:choice-of-anchor A domain-containing protein